MDSIDSDDVQAAFLAVLMAISGTPIERAFWVEPR